MASNRTSDSTRPAGLAPSVYWPGRRDGAAGADDSSALRSCRDNIDGPLCAPDNRCPAHHLGSDLAALRSLRARVNNGWVPANDAELRAWAEGYTAGWNQGYLDGQEAVVPVRKRPVRKPPFRKPH
ncbi:hypothetical protein [Micromonospora costi]|uniref:Uncharacterized protein n=1 Tax=Micromonospora costi TaxID=1530042 RepID=A0A3B0A6R3_9ACTN|nr:hypothetical protein [Micromonospora costi]RKN55990.1 hypothetical protein D7193_15510 [Micromonospora costi]